MLGCSETVVQALDVHESDKSLILVTLVTCCWAKYLFDNEQLPKPEQLIKALVVNFFLNLSAPGADRQPDIDESQYSNSYLVKVYHALLVWKSLYCNVYNLNAMSSK